MTTQIKIQSAQDNTKSAKSYPVSGRIVEITDEDENIVISFLPYDDKKL